MRGQKQSGVTADLTTAHTLSADDGCRFGGEGIRVLVLFRAMVNAKLWTSV